MLSKYLEFWLLFLRCTNAFYYSSGLCPKIDPTGVKLHNGVVLTELYRFVDENTVALHVDHGYCTIYSFVDENFIVVSTFRVCNDYSVYKNVSFFRLQPQNRGGFAMKKDHSDKRIFESDGLYPSEEIEFCSNAQYFGNDNVTDTRIIMVNDIEYPTIFIMWGCDQINDLVNKQKLIVLGSGLKEYIESYVDEVVQNFTNSGILKESAIKHPIQPKDPFCGLIILRWMEQSSTKKLRGSILCCCVIILHLLFN